MRLRSLLFIPADSEKKLEKGDQVAADALILDLEDSVAGARKPAARLQALNYLKARKGNRSSQLWVRINPLNTPDAALDLEAVLAGRPDGIVQPKVHGVADVIELGQHLHRLESELGIAIGATRILPVATETAQAMFALGQYSVCGQRLAGLTWGAEDLSSALGAVTNKDAAGNWTFPYQVARAFCLFGAAAADVPAIDTIHASIRDPDGLRSSCVAARRDGFSGKLAIHPGQVDVINEAFMPGNDEIAHAQRVLAAFAAQPGAGSIDLDGQMLDIPHLRL
ncbi:MAG: HpcH/HpaI aldolase/citrate lyase family protein, partial [Lysobacterales bacterium]